MTYELRHGFTIADIGRIARSAAANAGAYATDFSDRYDLAYTAIAEALYSAAEPPIEHDLFNAGRNAIWRDVSAISHLQGLTSAPGGGTRVMPSYERYWRHHAAPIPSPETMVVDHLAAWQIFPELTPLQRDAILAFAAHGNSLIATANALGISVSTMSHRVNAARRRFFELWHEGETPSKSWRKNQPRQPDVKLVPCGTASAYTRHKRRGEQVCGPCWEARRTYIAQRRQAAADENVEAA